MRIYIDTNWFLAFYQSVTEPASVLELLRAHAHRIVLTDQTHLEFYRNRGNLLQAARKKLFESAEPKPWTVSVLKEMDEFKAVARARDQYDAAKRELLGKVDALIANERSDPIAQTFAEVWLKCKALRATDVQIQSARTRKLRGKPPTTNNRNTIGDELIWECLLDLCGEDLAVVSLDSDFLDHAEMLKDEYYRRADRHLLYVGRNLSEALGKFGVRSKELEELERDTDPGNRCRDCGDCRWEPVGTDEKSGLCIFKCGSCGAEILVV